MKAPSLPHLAWLPLVAFVAAGCKKEEPPPPLPSAQPVVANTAPLQLKPEDAAVPSAEVPPPPVKKGGGGGGGLAACCAALQQNSTMAPEPTKTYMMQAAGLCQALAAQGKDKAAVGGMLMGALRGAGMPTACK